MIDPNTWNKLDHNTKVELLVAVAQAEAEEIGLEAARQQARHATEAAELAHSRLVHANMVLGFAQQQARAPGSAKEHHGPA